MREAEVRTRRSVLMMAAAALTAACAGEGGENEAVPGPSPAPSQTPSATPRPQPPRALTAAPALERATEARLGVYARDTGTGAAVAYRGDERFPMCSTFKVLAAGAVMRKEGAAGLDRRLSGGQSLQELCDAAVRNSDNAAANLLLEELGGPAAVTAFARSLGDRVTRLDRIEPDLNEARPGDPRDTTSPAAMAADLGTLLLGDALGTAERALLREWTVGSTTGEARIRAVLPDGWTAADKTGTGAYGTANDVAVLWPPGGAPVLLAVFSTHARNTAWPDDELVANAAEAALAAL